MTNQQLIHKANGIKRIKQAIANCDLPPCYEGTIYSNWLKIISGFDADFVLKIMERISYYRGH